MNRKILLITFLGILIFACNAREKRSELLDTGPSIKVVGAMKNVMRKGELAGIIKLDTIKNRKGLYGLGPERFLTGELLINNGHAYVSRVLSDSTMAVEKTFEVAAPFFVYGHVQEWQELALGEHIKTIKDLETLIDEQTQAIKRPFAFKLSGRIVDAIIHIQNLPAGTKVSSPEEAHQGQTNYTLQDEEVEIVGFFSTEHKGVFTHHDSFLHLHLITKDERKMGHLDKVTFGTMKLFVPKEEQI